MSILDHPRTNPGPFKMVTLSLSINIIPNLISNVKFFSAINS